MGNRAKIAPASFISSLLEGSSCAFGVFDGVHRGHALLLEQARKTARDSGGLCIALTFSIDPDELFAPGRLVKLMTNEQRLTTLAESGVDAVAVLEFDHRFAALSPEEFLERVFGATTPAHLHVGAGFQFGCKCSGDVSTLEKWGAAKGMNVHCHDLLHAGGEPVSSTRIRALLADGDAVQAELLLGRSLASPFV